jgi:hypothetical protein
VGEPSAVIDPNEIQLDRADLLNREVAVFIQQIRNNNEQRTDYGLTITE